MNAQEIAKLKTLINQLKESGDSSQVEIATELEQLLLKEPTESENLGSSADAIWELLRMFVAPNLI